MPGPTFIETDRLALCTVEKEDVDFLQANVNDPEVRRYITVFRTPYSRERYREELYERDTSGDAVSLLAVPRESDEPVGSFQLSPVRHEEGWANLGVWLAPDARGQGYATEASAHLVEYAFRELGLHRVSGTVLGPNEDSHRLMERLGFTREGARREAAFVDGEYADQVAYGLLAREWDGPDAVLDGDD